MAAWLLKLHTNLKRTNRRYEIGLLNNGGHMGSHVTSHLIPFLYLI